MDGILIVHAPSQPPRRPTSFSREIGRQAAKEPKKRAECPRAITPNVHIYAGDENWSLMALCTFRAA
jgi:hypothetical protein